MDGINNDDNQIDGMRGGRRRRGSKKRHGNASLRAWVTFVKKVQREEKVSYKEAMMRAKKRKDNGEKWRGGALMGGEDADDVAAYDDAVAQDADDVAAYDDSVAQDADDVADIDDMEGGRRRRRTRRHKSRKHGRKSRKHGRKSRKH